MLQGENSRGAPLFSEEHLTLLVSASLAGGGKDLYFSLAYFYLQRFSYLVARQPEVQGAYSSM